jgi:hypothetical protein
MGVRLGGAAQLGTATGEVKAELVASRKRTSCRRPTDALVPVWRASGSPGPCRRPRTISASVRWRAFSLLNVNDYMRHCTSSRGPNAAEPLEVLLLASKHRGGGLISEIYWCP